MKFVASGGIFSPCNLVSYVWWFSDWLVALAVAEWATAFEEFVVAKEELVLGSAFLEAFVGAGGSGLIFNSESGSTPAPIGLQ